MSGNSQMILCRKQEPVANVRPICDKYVTAYCRIMERCTKKPDRRYPIRLKGNQKVSYMLLLQDDRGRQVISTLPLELQAPEYPQRQGV